MDEKHTSLLYLLPELAAHVHVHRQMPQLERSEWVPFLGQLNCDTRILMRPRNIRMEISIFQILEAAA